MHNLIPALPCQHCPWRLGSPRFVWPTERFNDLQFERLTTRRASAVRSSACSSEHHDSICEPFAPHSPELHSPELHSPELHSPELPCVEMRPANAPLWLGSEATVHNAFFPSFEAMADANGAGLYDWTAQLTPGDLVVHFLCGAAIGVLEVKTVRNGFVQAGAKSLLYFFNALGYEMKCTSDSRILPATRATLESFVLQPDLNETREFL
jgi:hypothetical protein